MNSSPAETAAWLLTEFQRLGIEVRRVGDRLRYRPRDAMPGELAAKIASCKSDLLPLVPEGDEAIAWNIAAERLIAQCPDDRLRSDLRDHFEAIASTLKFDQGLSRDDAEMQAFGQLIFHILRCGIDARTTR